MAELILQYSDGRRDRLTLRNHPVTIGRDISCDVTIDDPSASRRHVRFVPEGDGFVVEDLGSKNGTLVNNEPCSRAILRSGDQVLIGSTLAIFSTAGAESSQGVVVSDDPATTRATRYVSHTRELLLPQRRLQMIYDLSERLTKLQSQDDLLHDAMEICFEMLQFERGTIGVRTGKGKEIDWLVVRNLRGAEGELRISRSLLNRALEHGERAMFTEDGGGSADPTVSMVQQGIRSAMCVPLAVQDEILGVIYGDRTSTSAVYTEEDIDFLAGIAKQVSIGLINSRLLEEQREMARLHQEIDLARTIQTGLFPSQLPNSATLKVAAINDPGNHVSGDYYDVITTDQDKTWCLVADVTGEGIAAALLMANLQAAVRLTIGDHDDPAELLDRWNKLICANTESSKFITCSLALLDPASKTLHVASAGHCRPYVVRVNGAPPEQLEVDSGYPLGVVEDATFVTSQFHIDSTPFVYFLYTDGVTEAMNAQGEQFGEKRLCSVLESAAEQDPTPFVKHVRRDVGMFADGAPQSDDITILAARVG